jgi:hypothetical protein
MICQSLLLLFTIHRDLDTNRISFRNRESRYLWALRQLFLDFIPRKRVTSASTFS